MEREKELAKLVNVLRRTSRMALQSEWTGSSQDAARFCVEQYNRVLARLQDLDPDVAGVFDALPAESSLTVAAMACRQLAAYYEDEVGRAGWGEWGGVWGDPRYGAWVDKKAFKDFWSKSAREIEDFGEFIRDNIEDWVKQYKAKDKPAEGCGPTTTKLDPEDTKPQ
ncbi:MAG TPA: hypothetical protein VNS63_13315 [Blastocatellia bacterium]|nr:hypothetical protein [Blastocatellia bacterium]